MSAQAPHGTIANHGRVMPPGWCYMMVMVSILKRWLVKCPMNAGDRLSMLEHLTEIGDGSCGITAEAVAAVQPADDHGAKIIEEALTLDLAPDVGPAGQALDVFASAEVWNALVRCNPSLLAAVDLCGHTSHFGSPAGPAP